MWINKKARSQITLFPNCGFVSKWGQIKYSLAYIKSTKSYGCIDVRVWLIFSIFTCLQ